MRATPAVHSKATWPDSRTHERVTSEGRRPSASQEERTASETQVVPACVPAEAPPGKSSCNTLNSSKVFTSLKMTSKEAVAEGTSDELLTVKSERTRISGPAATEAEGRSVAVSPCPNVANQTLAPSGLSCVPGMTDGTRMPAWNPYIILDVKGPSERRRSRFESKSSTFVTWSGLRATGVCLPSESMKASKAPSVELICHL